MTRSRRTISVLAVTIAALASACGDRRTVSPAGSATSYPRGADELVFRISTAGGFVAPQQTLQQTPSFSLYGDGRAITQRAQIEIYPGPALPSLVVTSITPAGVQALVADAVAAGLRNDRSYSTMPVSDMPTTTFTLDAGGKTHTTTVYGLGAGTGGQPGISAAERNARAALEHLSTEVGDLRHTLPTGSVGPDRAYTPDGLRVFVQSYDGQRDPMLHEPEIAWPLSDPLATFGEETSTPSVRCGTVSGSDLAPLLKLAVSANQLTRWRSNGNDYSLTFRVLLPDEHGC
ncbi:MAG: hypothetical protein ACJ76P_10680 [Actinomycetota bacterium]